MESTIITSSYGFAPKEKAFPSDFLSLLDQYADNIKVLSLDCFDTILWRKTAKPIDVFYSLQQKTPQKKIGLNALLRARIESQARNFKVIQAKNSEVTLHDIYQISFPHLSSAELNALIEAELESEIEMCYAFPPMVKLMRAALSRGLKLIIVSNTYLTEPQLRRLLGHHLPKEILECIDIFCSCEFDSSKNNKLFEIVLEKLGCAANEVWHIGDDQKADFLAPKSLGLHATQLTAHDSNIDELKCLHMAAAALFNPAVRHTNPLLLPFHGILASTRIEKPEQVVGYASIGPILYTFGKFILEEIDALKKQGKNPKVLFLMRDAYLPSLVCDALASHSVGKPIRISRFAALAASFRTKDDIALYLSQVLSSDRFHDIANQLLLPKQIAEPLVKAIEGANSRLAEAIHLFQRDDIQQIIFKLSAAYRQRLIRYLEKEIDLKRGDTLLFVDLGYAGTAQQKLEPIFREELGVEIIGRYLIQLDIPSWQTSRRGLLDTSWCDERAMLCLVSYIALLEQICTSEEKSVTDYDTQGNPIFSDTGFSKNQYEKLKKIQNECLRFINDAKHFFTCTKELPLSILRETAMAELGRFVFLPTESEVHYLESFQFDLNLGTHDVLQVFNPAEGLASLRKRGLFFSFMEKNKKTMRTNYPAELRSAGLELVTTLMVQHRFGIDFRFKDMSLRRESIPAAVIQGEHSNIVNVEATPTHDGYYSLNIPIGNHDFYTSLLFGQQYEWIQFESAEIITMDSFLKKTESLHAEDYWPSLVFHDMTHKNSKLYECHSNASAIVIPPLQRQNAKDSLIRIVFRPIVSKSFLEKENSSCNSF